jgi:hypothetical protein
MITELTRQNNPIITVTEQHTKYQYWLKRFKIGLELVKIWLIGSSQIIQTDPILELEEL